VSQEPSSIQSDKPTAHGDSANEARAGRSFPCEGCGADLVFHIGVQNLKCPYCGFVKTLVRDPQKHVDEQDYLVMLERIAELRDQRSKDGVDQDADFREIRCTSCAAVMRFQKNLGSSECVYCGGVLQPTDAYDAKHRIGVDGVLPFMVDKKAAGESLRAWVKSRWFAPNEFTKRGVTGRFSGVFTPYWTYDSLTHTYYTGQRGEHYYVTVGSGKNRRQERRTRWYPASGELERFFDDVLVVASTGLPIERIIELEPWPLTKCRPFDPRVLAGFIARTYDVELSAGFEIARSIMKNEIEKDVRADIGGDTQRIHSVDTSHHAITFKHLLLPIWMLAYKYKSKSYQVVINACTGEVHGDRPYSWVKITLAVLAAAAVGGAIAWFAANR